MEFTIHSPSRILQPFVQCYASADFSEAEEGGTYTLFPNGLSGIFFNFGTTGRISITKETQVPAVSIFGQIDRHFTISHHPGFSSLGMLFKPTVLSWLLKLNMSEFTNRACDAIQISPPLGELHKEMAEKESIESKIEILENYFTSLLVNKATPNNLVDFALNIMHHEEMISMSSLAARLKISQRHLENQFKKSVGLSPKTYSLILRFKRMEEQLRKMPQIHWKDMAFASEYYDQTHFIKDFRRFTGLTPSSYLLKQFEMGRSYLSAK